MDRLDQPPLSVENSLAFLKTCKGKLATIASDTSADEADDQIHKTIKNMDTFVTEVLRAVDGVIERVTVAQNKSDNINAAEPSHIEDFAKRMATLMQEQTTQLVEHMTKLNQQNTDKLNVKINELVADNIRFTHQLQDTDYEVRQLKTAYTRLEEENRRIRDELTELRERLTEDSYPTQRQNGQSLPMPATPRVFGSEDSRHTIGLHQRDSQSRQLIPPKSNPGDIRQSNRQRNQNSIVGSKRKRSLPSDNSRWTVFDSYDAQGVVEQELEQRRGQRRRLSTPDVNDATTGTSLTSETTDTPGRKASNKPKGEAVYTMEDLFNAIDFYDDSAGRQPATSLADNVKAALTPHLQQYLSAAGWYNLTSRVQGQAKCAIMRYSNGGFERNGDFKHTCEYCDYWRQLCILVEKNQRPVIVPRLANSRVGVSPSDLRYWVRDGASPTSANT